MQRTRRLGRVLEYGMLAGSAAWSGCVMARPARTALHPSPRELDVHAMSFSSRSGSTIRGWMLSGERGQGAVLLLHGVGDNRTSMLGRARFLHRLGYTVLLPDFQAHGESTGEHITFGALESFDAEAAVAFLRQCDAGDRVALIGVSMGGAAALLGPGPVHADAIVLESVYPTIRQAVEDRLRVWMGPFGALNRAVAPLIIRGVSAEIGISEDALRPIDRIGLVNAPLLVITGSRDRYTPLDEARALFAQAREPKTLWIVEGAGHEDLHAFDVDVYERTIGSFLARHLRESTRVVAHNEQADDSAPAIAASCG